MSLDASPDSVALLPTDGIKDPQVRNFLDRLVEAWDARNEGDKRFVTAGEFNGLATQALIGALGGGSGAAPGGPSNATLIDNLADSIIKSLLYQRLSAFIDPLDLAAIKGKADANGAAISSENTIRITRDLALASAINNIWASIGGSTAVIQDGSLAAATPTSATATRWTQVVSAVTDPNTGLVNSASIKQELNTYANNANSTFNAIYTVRAAVTSGGQTVAGGFGLSATTGAGSAQGPSIDFGVLANKFWIGAPASGYNPATEYTTNNQFPFIVVTTPTTINGVTYTAGVYMKKVVIGDASIDNAKIANLSVTTLKIGDESVTIPRWNFSAGNSATVLLTVPAGLGGARVCVIASVSCPNAGFLQSITIDGTDVRQESAGPGTIPSLMFSTTLASGSHTISVSNTDPGGFNACCYVIYTMK